jgi:TetR/AcrR family transcriptional regulator
MGIAERRQREKEQRRNTILDAAEAVFFSSGISLATMDEVAEKAELSKGTLYIYFKSKDELYLAISYRALSLLKDMFGRAVRPKNQGIEKIRAIGEAYYKYSQTYPDYFNMILHYENSQAGPSISPAILSKCHELGRGVMQIVAGAIEIGLKDGTIRSNLDPVRTAFLLQGLSTGIIQLISREKDHIDNFETFQARDLMDDFMDLMYHGLQQNGILDDK